MAKQKRIALVIDDDLSMLKLLEKWLSVDGYEIINASTGELGVKRAIEDNPDIILLDVILPDLKGADVVRELKKHPESKDIPIIFVTVTVDLEKDKGDEHIEVDGVQYQAFAKPLHTRKLLADMRKAINRYRHGNE